MPPLETTQTTRRQTKHHRSLDSQGYAALAIPPMEEREGEAPSAASAPAPAQQKPSLPQPQEEGEGPTVAPFLKRKELAFDPNHASTAMVSQRSC